MNNTARLVTLVLSVCSLLVVEAQAEQRQTSGFSAAQQQQTPDAAPSTAPPAAAPTSAPPAAQPAPVGPPAPRRATIPRYRRAQPRQSPQQRRVSRMQRVIEHNRSPLLLVASANRTIDTGNTSVRSELLFQPYFALQRAIRLGVFIETPETGNNDPTLASFLGGQLWLTESINVYAQINFDMLTEDIDIGGDVGLTVYLTRAFAFNIYSGLSEGRSTYVGLGIAFDWRNLFRMGVFF